MNLEQVFPYSTFREGQRELAESVYSACKNGDRLVVEAMSGFGKTAPVLAGSILAATERGNRIIYACRTKRQVFRVMEEIERIQKRVPAPATYLFSKNDYCLLKEMSRFPVSQESFKWYCSFNVTNNLCSYFMNVALLERQVTSLVRKFTTSTSPLSNLLKESRELHICPYEVARLGIADSRIVVTTYHYLLDEASRSVLLSGMNADPSKMTIVIDEAHNVREFVKGASTLGLSFGDLEQAAKDARELYLENVGSSLKEIIGGLNNLCSAHTSWYVEKDEFVRSISRGHDEAWLPNLAFELSTCAGVAWQSIAVGRNLPASIVKVGNFLKTLLSSLEIPQFTIVKSERGFYLVNTDPSQRFAALVRDYQSLVLLSATINPSELFLRSIGLEKDTHTHKVGPSNTFQVRTLIDVGVSTRYKLRSPEMYSKMARKISAICGCVGGGIGIFVPSYSVLEALERLLSDDLRGRRTMLTETRGLANSEAEQTMQTFKSTPGSVLLAVQGGRFSEGEDFPGDQMDASVVIGLSLPPPSPLMYAEYRQTLFSKHEAYMVISLLPALRKAIQAAGRHMRSPEKRGLVFFLDSRFDDKKILDMLPGWLKQDMLKGDFEPGQIEQLVREFQVRSAPL